MAGLASSGVWKFAPVVAIGGLALAVGAWVVPLGGLGVTPEETSEGSGVALPVGVHTRNDLPTIAQHDWKALVEPLMAVRTPYPTSTDPETDNPPPPPLPPEDDLLDEWRFAGTVTEPEGVVAIVSIDGDQRYFRIGQKVTLGDGVTTGEIVGVAHDHVVVRVEAVDRKVTTDGPQRESGSAPAVRDRPARPNRSRNNPAGGGS